MGMRRTRSWTVAGDSASIDAVISDFTRRRGIEVDRSGRRITLRRGSPRRAGGGSARLARQEDLPLKGTIEVDRGERGTLRVRSTFQSDGAGLIMGRGPVVGRVKRRFDQLFGELLNDLGQSLGST